MDEWGWMECEWCAMQRRHRKSFVFFSSFFSFARIMDSKGSLKATAKVSLWSGSRAENVVDPRFVGADETLTKPDVCSVPLSYVAFCAPRSRSIERVSRSCVFKGAKVRGGAERGFTRPCVDAHSYRLGASPKLSGPLASAPTSRAPVQLRRAFEPGRC